MACWVSVKEWDCDDCDCDWSLGELLLVDEEQRRGLILKGLWWWKLAEKESEF